MSTNDDTNVGGALEALLDQELSFEATTGRGLTNHLPMALVAKAGLGAPEDELSRFAATYRDRLVACEKSSTQLTTATWQRAIGQSGWLSPNEWCKSLWVSTFAVPTSSLNSMPR
jgi:hypothetical protein